MDYGSVITSNWPIILIKVDPHTVTFATAHATSTSTAKRDGHDPVHVRQHDGHPNTCQPTISSSLSDFIPLQISVTEDTTGSSPKAMMITYLM